MVKKYCKKIFILHRFNLNLGVQTGSDHIMKTGSGNDQNTRIWIRNPAYIYPDAPHDLQEDPLIGIQIHLQSACLHMNPGQGFYDKSIRRVPNRIL